MVTSLIFGIAQAALLALWSTQFLPGKWILGAIMEFGFTTYFALCLLHPQNRLTIAVPLVAFALLLPPAIGMSKYQFLMNPAGFADIFEVSGLVLQYGIYGWVSAIILGVCGILLIVLYCRNWRRPSIGGVILWAPAVAFWCMILAKFFLPLSMAHALPSAPTVRPGLASLPPPILLGNWGSFLRSAVIYADRRIIMERLRGAADPDFGFTGNSLDGAEKRNIYFIVLESFMDPRAIAGATYSTDPFSPLFQRWRRESGLTALSPVFGHRSADAEFEAYCGLPVALDGAPVVFPQITVKELDCLPRKLARLGWQTETLTLANPRLYNYGQIYPKLGFQKMSFADSVVTDDVDRLDMPSADAVLSQNLARVDELLASGKPFFTSVFGSFGHFPYTLDTAKRPYSISVNSESADLHAYVNNVHYTSVAVAGYVDKVLAKDPDALIVAFGDHHPVLRNTSPPISYPGTKMTQYDVPLLIINGRHGFVPLHGRVPLYLVPGIVSDLLTAGRFCAANACGHRAEQMLRPLPEALLAIDRTTGSMTDCLKNAGDELCTTANQRAARFQAALVTMIGDQ